MIDRLIERFIKFLYFSPLKLLFIGLVLVIAVIPGALKLEKDFSFRRISSPNNPRLKNFDLYEKKFGNDDSLSVMIHDEKGIFNKEMLIFLRDLQAELVMVPGTLRVESLLDGNTVSSTEDEIEIRGVVRKEELDNLNESDLPKIKAQALASPQIANYLVSPDATVTSILLFLNPTTLKNSNTYDYTKNAEKVIEKFKSRVPNADIRLTGPAYLNKIFIETSRSDQERLFPIILGIFALLSVVVFKNFKGVIILLGIIVINILSTLGIQGYFGFPINGFTSTAGVIMTTITTGALIHFMAGFYSHYNVTGDTIGSLVNTYRVNLSPTFLTSFTTTVGFYTLSDKDLIPVYQLGLIIGTATIVSWFNIILLLGPILRYCHKQKVPPTLAADGIPVPISSEDKKSSAFAKRYVAWVNRYKNHIIITWVVILLGSIAVLPTLKVRVNPFEQFSARIPIVKTKELIKKKFGFSIFAELLIDTGEIDGGKKAAHLKKLVAFESELARNSEIVKNVSLTDIIKEMNQTFNGGKAEEYRLPETDEAISQYLLLYSFGDKNGKLKNFLSEDGRFLKSSIFMRLEQSNLIMEEIERIESLAKKYDLNLVVTGKLPLYMEMGAVVFKVIGKSAMLSLLLISLTMFIIVRSVRFGFLAMIPNVVPVIIGGGVMYLMNFSIDIGTTLIFSVCLGVAVDDTIHFVHHWIKSTKEGRTPEETFEHIIMNLFPMIIATTVILSFGFGVFSLADFLGNVKFGILTAIILLIAMFADLFLLPAILLKKSFKN